MSHCSFHITYDDHELFYIDGGNDFGDDKNLESESPTIPNVENDLDTNKGYYSSWWPTLTGKWNKNQTNKMNFIKDNNTLLRAKAETGWGKSVVINKYNDKVYVHLFGAKGKHVALYFKEYKNLVSLKDQVEEACR